MKQKTTGKVEHAKKKNSPVLRRPPSFGGQGVSESAFILQNSYFHKLINKRKL